MWIKWRRKMWQMAVAWPAPAKSLRPPSMVKSAISLAFPYSQHNDRYDYAAVCCVVDGQMKGEQPRHPQSIQHESRAFSWTRPKCSIWPLPSIRPRPRMSPVATRSNLNRIYRSKHWEVGAYTSRSSALYPTSTVEDPAITIHLPMSDSGDHIRHG